MSNDRTTAFALPRIFVIDAPDSQNIIGDKGKTKTGLAKVGGKIEAKGLHECVPGPLGEPVHVAYWSSSASMACTGSAVVYWVWDPSVDSPKYYGAEPGY
jgi:hypothetical protein